MRNIKFIVVHCTATAHNTKVESILKYWKEKKKWKNVGYHYLIEANGKINQLASEESITNGVAGYNSNSIHVCYIGGKLTDDRTRMQKHSLLTVLIDIRKRYPKSIIQGHRDFPGVTKSCPRFDAIKEYSNI